jgi:hypothetical protein
MGQGEREIRNQKQSENKPDLGATIKKKSLGPQKLN